MSLRERLERGPERRRCQVEGAPLRRRTDMVAVPMGPETEAERAEWRPAWLDRITAKDRTGEVRS